jgi:hypothetical protein
MAFTDSILCQAWLESRLFFIHWTPEVLHSRALLVFFYAGQVLLEDYAASLWTAASAVGLPIVI